MLTKIGRQSGERPEAALRVPVARPDELLHLDLLRFVAAVGIVLTHSAEFLVPRDLRPALGPRAGVLALFVDTFFVISGYVIAHIYAGRIGGWRDYATFLQRRVARLVPLHLVMVAVWALLYVAVRVSGVSVNHPVSLSASCLTTTTALLTAYVDCGGRPVGDVNWSISAEMGMYLLLPVFLWLAAGGAWRALLFAAGLFVAMLVWRGDSAIWQARQDVSRALPAFPIGIAMFFARDLLARLPSAQLGLGAAVAALFALTVVPALNWLALAIAYALPAWAVAADLQGRGGRVLRRWAPLGQLTYSVYMIHGVVIVVVLNAVADKLLKLPLPGMWAAAAVTFALIAWASRASFMLVEQPARTAINRVRLFGRGPRRIIAEAAPHV